MHQSHLAAAASRRPRPWLSRGAGECAFPVGGSSWETVSCCNPCRSGDYCDAHVEIMRGPPAPDADALFRDLARVLR